jgi:hypothetical protein
VMFAFPKLPLFRGVPPPVINPAPRYRLLIR